MKTAMTIVLAGTCAMMLHVTVAEAKTWKGIWDNNRDWHSTLNFLGDKRLTYCFRGDCYTTVYTGSKTGTVRFNWGRANFQFKWNGSGYNGTRRAGGNTNRARLK